MNETGCGCLAGVFLGVMGLVIGLVDGNVGAGAVTGVLLAGGSFFVGNRLTASRKAREERARQERWNYLCYRFGPEAATAIFAQRFWQGATREMIVESLGRPADTKLEVLKTKTKETLCYYPMGANRFALRIYLEDDIVNGWKQN